MTHPTTEPPAIDGQLAHRRALAAERLRRCRARKRRALVCASVDVRKSEIAALVRLRLPAREDQGNSPAIGRALGRLLDRVLANV